MQEEYQAMTLAQLKASFDSLLLRAEYVDNRIRLCELRLETNRQLTRQQRRAILIEKKQYCEEKLSNLSRQNVILECVISKMWSDFHIQIVIFLANLKKS